MRIFVIMKPAVSQGQIGDVINYRAIESQQITQSLRSTLSTVSSNTSGSYGRNNWEATSSKRDYADPCNCSLCVAVAKRQFFSLSSTNGFDEYRVCHRTNRLNDASRLQEINCWKCRNHCWHNYSISHAWLKKKKSLPVYKRRPHQQIAKLPQITEPLLDAEAASSSILLQSSKAIMKQNMRDLNGSLPECYSRMMDDNNEVKLPPIKSRKKGLTVSMLPRAVISEVFGVVPNTDFHYNEKTDAQMRWLLIKASLKRIITMDQKRKMQVQGSFSTLISNIKLMEQRKAEELKRQEQLEIEKKIMETKQSVVKKIKLTKVKNSIENAIKAERERKVKEMQLKKARQKLLNHKINVFRESIEVYQRKISKFLFPKTTILIDTKRLKFRRHLFMPKSRPKLIRSQSELNVRDPLVDKLWMEPQVDDFLSSVEWLNELIMNKMRTDFIERISKTFLLPMSVDRCKSVPCVNMQDVDYRFHLGKRNALIRCATWADLSERPKNQKSGSRSWSLGRGSEKLAKEEFVVEDTFMEFYNMKEKSVNRQLSIGNVEFEDWVTNGASKMENETKTEHENAQKTTKAHSADDAEINNYRKSKSQLGQSKRQRLNSAPTSQYDLSANSLSSIRPLKTVVFDLNKLAVRSFTAYRSVGSSENASQDTADLRKALGQKLNLSQSDKQPKPTFSDESASINTSKTALDPITSVKNNSGSKLEEKSSLITSDVLGDNGRGKKNIRRLSKLALLGKEKDRLGDEKSKPNMGRRKTLAKISTEATEKQPPPRLSKMATMVGKAAKGTTWKKLKNVVQAKNTLENEKNKNKDTNSTVDEAGQGPKAEVQNDTKSQVEEVSKGPKAEMVESVVIESVDGGSLKQISTENEANDVTAVSKTSLPSSLNSVETN